MFYRIMKNGLFAKYNKQIYKINKNFKKNTHTQNMNFIWFFILFLVNLILVLCSYVITGCLTFTFKYFQILSIVFGAAISWKLLLFWSKTLIWSCNLSYFKAFYLIYRSFIHLLVNGINLEKHIYPLSFIIEGFFTLNCLISYFNSTKNNNKKKTFSIVSSRQAAYMYGCACIHAAVPLLCDIRESQPKSLYTRNPNHSTKHGYRIQLYIYRCGELFI